VADYVTVANLALSKLGEDDQIRDPDQDSHAARSVRAVWGPIRRATLRAGKFNFSVSRDELTAQASSSPGYVNPFPYANRFPLPDGCLRLVEVYSATGILLEQYRLEGGAILCDEASPLFVVFIRDVVEVGNWDDLFVEAFAAHLAFQIADRITGDRGRKSDCWGEYRKRVKDAAGVDAKEDPPENAYESSWVTARGSSSLGGPPNV
jgi:hypothetical protein